jgi:hypothetical protein
MFHAQKQHWMGCAVATAATVSGLTYEEVESLAGTRSLETLRHPYEARWLIQRATHVQWRCRAIVKPRPLRDISLQPWPAALFLQDERHGQWVAAKGNLVHDPELALACAINEYCRRDWLVRHWLEPAAPSWLTPRPRASFVLSKLTAELSASGCALTQP